MPRFTFIQNNLAAGQISEKLYYRTDIKEYKSGAKVLQNMLPYKSGGAYTRPALRYARSHSVTNLDKTLCFAIPFIFSKDEVYDIEFLIGNPALYSISMTPSDYIRVYDINNVAQTLSVDNPILLENNDSAMYEESDIYGWSYAQSADVIIMTHSSGNIRPLIIYRTGSAGAYTFNFKYLTYDYTGTVGVPDIIGERPHIRLPYLDANSDPDITLSTSTATAGASGTLTCSQAIFTANHVGTYYLIEDGGSPGSIKSLIVEVTAVAGPPSTTATIYVHAVAGAFATGTPYNWWYESAWSKKNGYPRTVCIFENRVIFGGTKSKPDTIFGSAQYSFGIFNRFVEYLGPGVFAYQRDPGGADEPFQFTIASNTVDAIAWLSAGRTLQVGTLTKEYLVSGGDTSLSRLNVQITPQSYYGAYPYPAVNSNFRTYFISRDGRSVIELGYSSENGSYVSRNISILADDLIFRDQADLSARFVQLQWQSDLSTLWALTNDGRLFSCTIDQTSGVLAWATHPMTGTTLYSLWTRPNNAGKGDNLLAFAENSTINDADLLATLKMAAPFENPTLFNNSTEEEDRPIYADFGYYATKAGGDPSFTLPSAITGLEGDALLEDGTIQTGLEIGLAGALTVTGTHTKVIFGVPYTHQVVTLTPEVGPNDLLASQGDIVRIDRATAFFYKTWYAQAGSGSTLYDVELSATPFTGKHKIDVPASPDTDNDIIIKSSKPLPMAVLGIVMRGVNNN